jgi:hypothetical protein
VLVPLGAGKRVSIIRMAIASTEKGTKYDDTCVGLFRPILAAKSGEPLADGLADRVVRFMTGRSDAALAGILPEVSACEFQLDAPGGGAGMKVSVHHGDVAQLKQWHDVVDPMQADWNEAEHSGRTYDVQVPNNGPDSAVANDGRNAGFLFWKLEPASQKWVLEKAYRAH